MAEQMTKVQAVNQARISVKSARSILGWAATPSDVETALDELNTAIEMLNEVQNNEK